MNLEQRIVDYWNAQPCNINHGKSPVGTKEFLLKLANGDIGLNRTCASLLDIIHGKVNEYSKLVQELAPKLKSLPNTVLSM